MSYLRKAWDGQRMYGESIESVYNIYDMSRRGKGIESWVIERINHSTLRSFDHKQQRMPEWNDKECCTLVKYR